MTPPRMRRLVHRWRDRRGIVLIPDGRKRFPGMASSVTLVSPKVVAIEATHDLHASPEQIAARSPRQARLIFRWRGFARYRVDESLRGRSAAGDWVAGEGGMVLRAICLVPRPGFPLQ